MRRLLSAALLLGLPAAADGIEPVARVTSDSSEYCAELAGRLATLPRARFEPAASLGADGLRLCAEGHTRTGVAKLRRAIRAAQAGP